MSRRDDVLRRFEPKMLTKEQAAEIEGVLSAFHDTADWILNVTISSREQSNALTALEEAKYWTNQAIAMHGLPDDPAAAEMRANLEAVLDINTPSAPAGEGQGPATPSRVAAIVESLRDQGVSIARGLTDSDQDAADAKVSHIDEHRTRTNRRVVNANANETDPAAPFTNGGFTGGRYEPVGVVHRGSFHFPSAATDPSSPPMRVSISGQDLHEALIAILPTAIRDSIVPAKRSAA